MDVTNQESINTSVSKIKEDYGIIFGLVNNAGITNDNLLMRMSDEQWNTVIETNLTSLYRVTKSVVKDMMKARTGRIVNIGSIVGMMGNAGQSNYSASKAGIIGFSKSIALELGSRNIRSNVIAPGFIETDMTDSLSEDVINSWKESIPLKRGGNPSDVGNACVFLASDLSSYITGQTLHVDGGMLT
jgi:3-oxoacyl-[acyl-carrier protein] reductase